MGQKRESRYFFIIFFIFANSSPPESKIQMESSLLIMIKEEVKENQPARSAGWFGNDKNRSISNQKNYASKDKNSSSLIILTPSSFAFLFLEEAEAESLLIR